MSRKNIKVQQQDITDCAAACLSSICAYYGLFYPIARIRQYAHTDKKGTNILGIIEAADKLGISAKGVRAQVNALEIIPKPTIAHVVIKETYEHFVVIYKVKQNKVAYMDPMDGEMHNVSLEEFSANWTGVLVLMEPKETFKTGNVKISIYKQFLNLLTPHKKTIFQIVFGALIFSILGFSTPIYLGKITDYVLVDHNTNLLNLMGVIMVVLLLLQTFIGGMKSILLLKVGQKIDAVLILNYYKHLLQLPQFFFDTMRVGEIISRVNDAVKIRSFINETLVNLVVNLIVLILSVGIMFVYSWKLAFISLISAPIFLLILYAFNNLNKKYQRKIMESSADIESQLVESIMLVGTIKRFGIEEFANIKTESKFVRVLRNTYKSIYGSILTHSGVQLVSTGMIITILWLGSFSVVNREITPGTLMVFYSLISYVLSSVAVLIFSNQTIQDAVIAADRLFQIMDLEVEQDTSPKISLNKDMLGDIEFKDISFRYGSRIQVFQNLNLTIQKGKMTALVGESGSGKTTLMSLLQNIYKIESGGIYIGEHNISEIESKSLRRYIGTVPQQIDLFSGTIIENIAVGDFEPNLETIKKLTEQLGLSDFINNLPNGLMTYVGEHGVALSGGERQRLAIARALYRNPEIIIFDEATSSLDTISENIIKDTLLQLSKMGKTIILIAHRLSTIKNADRIIVLERGDIIEDGIHEDLISKGGTYSQLWGTQVSTLT